MTHIVFHPTSRPDQVWIITPDYVTVVNLLEGVSATVPHLLFATEMLKRGLAS